MYQCRRNVLQICLRIVFHVDAHPLQFLHTEETLHVKILNCIHCLWEPHLAEFFIENFDNGQILLHGLINFLEALGHDQVIPTRLLIKTLMNLYLMVTFLKFQAQDLDEVAGYLNECFPMRTPEWEQKMYRDFHGMNEALLNEITADTMEVANQIIGLVPNRPRFYRFLRDRADNVGELIAARAAHLLQELRDRLQNQQTELEEILVRRNAHEWSHIIFQRRVSALPTEIELLNVMDLILEDDLDTFEADFLHHGLFGLELDESSESSSSSYDTPEENGMPEVNPPPIPEVNADDDIVAMGDAPRGGFGDAM